MAADGQASGRERIVARARSRSLAANAGAHDRATAGAVALGPAAARGDRDALADVSRRAAAPLLSLMKTHPFLRAYMAGITVPTVALLFGMMAFVVARYVYDVPVPIERVIVF